MDIRAAEISAILKEQIKNFGQEAEVSESRPGAVHRRRHRALLRPRQGRVRRDGRVRIGRARHGAEPRDRQRRRRRCSAPTARSPRARRSSAPARSWTCPSARACSAAWSTASGNPIDGKGPIEYTERRRVDVKAPGIIPRKSVHEPMATGLKAIDRADPDRPRPARADHRRPPDRQDRDRARHDPQPEAVARQPATRRRSSTASTWRSARKRSTVAQFVKALEENGAMEYSVVIAATASDPAPMQFIAPFSGCAMGEYFREQRHARRDHLRRPLQAGRRLPPDVAAAAPPAGPRGVPGRRVLTCTRACSSAPPRWATISATAPLTALPVIETQAERRVRLHPHERDLDHRRADLPRDGPVLPGHSPGGERRPLGCRAWAPPRRPRR